MAVDVHINIQRAVLPNGLRVVHHYMPASTMVTLNVMYNTGARDEDPELTGLAHLFEHIMFGGSLNVPDFDGELTQAGGVSNAWTSNDFTNFYEIAPAHNAETLFHIESDRMLSPALDASTLDVQRSVVIEEFKQQCLNRPYGDMAHHLRKMVYGTEHPYSWPVIGKDFESLQRVTTDDVRNWWTRNYSPDNAVLSVTGNITFERTMELARKWFGDIAPRTRAPRTPRPVTAIADPGPRTFYGAVPATMITVAYLMDPYGTDAYYDADALTDVLSAGRASRFAEQLNMNPESPVVEADASILGSEDRGMLMLRARMASEDIDPAVGVARLIDTARSVITDGISDHEMQRIKNRLRSIFVMSNTDALTCAQTLAEAEMHGVDPDSCIARYDKLTAQRIIDTARRILDNQKPAILYYRPLPDK